MRQVGETVCIRKNGVLMTAAYDGSCWRIQRLLSTDPNDYLRADYAPGMATRLPEGFD